MKENKIKLDDELKNKESSNYSNPHIKPRVGTVPHKGIKYSGKFITRIKLPSIRQKGSYRLENSQNMHNLSSINNHQLPNLSKIHKSTYEMLPKERYLKYKSLLNKNKVGTDRNLNNKINGKLQSSSSSQNMSVQEKMLDKIYGTIDQNKHQL